jgi:serine/threonine protein phosphatase PrpC
MVDNELIASILAGEECPARQADMLCCSAMEAGGRDNISILLLKKQK